MLHISSMWDIGRSRNTSCYLSPLTYLEMQYLILVRCRIAVHLWNAFAPSLFRRRFFVCGPLLRLSQVRRAQGGGVGLSGRRQRSRPSRSFHEKAVELSFGIGVAVSLALISFGVWCHFTMNAIMRIPLVFLPVCAGLMIGLYCVEHLLRQR